MRSRRCLGVALVVLVLGCQPVDELPAGEPTPVGGLATPPVGAPDTAVPVDVPSLLDRLESTAASWQDEARPVEVVLELDGDGRWETARVIYLAPDADRLLLLRVGSDGTAQERPTLEGVGFHTVPAEGLAAVPAFPMDALEVPALLEASAPARDDCGLDEDPGLLVYATGAPAAWDGEGWTETPTWTATVGGEAGAVVLDPASGGITGPGCVEGT